MNAHTHTLACIHVDSRNQILLWDTSEKTQRTRARTSYAYAQIAQGSGGGKQNLRYRQAEKANRTDDLMVVNRLQGQKQILPSCWHVRLQASLRARPVSVIELCTPRARGSRRPEGTTGAIPRSRLSTPYGTKDATQCQAQRLAKNTDARARTRTHARTHTHTHTHTQFEVKCV